MRDRQSAKVGGPCTKSGQRSRTRSATPLRPGGYAGAQAKSGRASFPTPGSVEGSQGLSSTEGVCPHRRCPRRFFACGSQVTPDSYWWADMGPVEGLPWGHSGADRRHSRPRSDGWQIQRGRYRIVIADGIQLFDVDVAGHPRRPRLRNEDSIAVVGRCLPGSLVSRPSQRLGQWLTRMRSGPA